MQILRRHLRETLIHLIGSETVGRQHGRYLLVRRDIADDRQVGFTRVEALVRRRL
ncbi:hypothetical protein D3C83_293720 [compost metagenome]